MALPGSETAFLKAQGGRKWLFLHSGLQGNSLLGLSALQPLGSKLCDRVGCFLELHGEGSFLKAVDLIYGHEFGVGNSLRISHPMSMPL